MSANLYCVVKIEGSKDGHPAFMLDPYYRTHSTDPTPIASAKIKERARVVRAALFGTDPDHADFRALVAGQVGTALRVEPVIMAPIPE